MPDDVSRKVHELKDALKRMEHDMKHAERERKRAIRYALRQDARCYGDFGPNEEMNESGPRSVDEVLTEIDSYLSYLEDLPKERLAPHDDKIGDLGEHLRRVRSALKSDPGTK